MDDNDKAHADSFSDNEFSSGSSESRSEVLSESVDISESDWSSFVSSDDDALSHSCDDDNDDDDDDNACDDYANDAHWGDELLSTFRNRRPPGQKRYEGTAADGNTEEEDNMSEGDRKYGRGRLRGAHRGRGGDGAPPSSRGYLSRALWILRRLRRSRLTSKRATTVLLISVLAWLCVNIRRVQIDSLRGGETDRGVASRPSWSWGWGPGGDDSVTKEDLRRIKKEANHALGSAAGSHQRRRSRRNRRSGSGVPEKPQRGCDPSEWQKSNFQNCNDIHEIDLRIALHMKRFGPKLSDMGRGNLSSDEAGATFERRGSAHSSGYVGSGLWRSVWTVDPRGETGEKDEDTAIIGSHPAVLKVMKLEHKYDFRNLDRHRRDALVMERFTSNENIVDIYGFCGNTVLSEFAGSTLDKLIYKSEDGDADASDAFTQFTRETPSGRLRLALDVFRGLSAIHDIPGGGIIHADIQAKQFLVDPRAGVVKLNDFNRCRLIPHNVSTGESCPVRIPSAPGANRSPEEYRGVTITEKADVYSSAHVLYGILMGKRHWEGDMTSTIKENVKRGRMPPVPFYAG